MCTRSFYCLYDLNENEQCVMVQPLNRIAAYLGLKENTLRKAMYLNKRLKKRYVVTKAF